MAKCYAGTDEMNATRAGAPFVNKYRGTSTRLEIVDAHETEYVCDICIVDAHETEYVCDICIVDKD